MKKLVILSSLLLIAALAGAGALGVFTDSDTETGNAISTGNLDVDLVGSMNISNMVPGDTQSACLVIKNLGTTDMLFRSYINTVSQSPATFANRLEVTVTLRPSNGCDGLTGLKLYGPVDALIHQGSLSSLFGQANALNNISAWQEDPSWPLKVGYAAVYKIDVHLPLDTGNAYQNATFSGNIVVDATQSANQTYDELMPDGGILW